MTAKFPQLIDSVIEIDERVATLRLNRHDVRNALTGTSLVDDIITTTDWVNRNTEISALILTGEGSAFSAGGNVKDMRDRQGTFGGNVQQVQDNYRQSIQRMPLAITKTEVPIIAAINGPAIGAGFDLACMCDLRIASSEAIMGETFINLGIIPGDGGAWFLQRLIGYQRAAELTFTGRIIQAKEALELGIILNIFKPQDLLAEAMNLAQSIAAKPPHAVRFTKRLMQTAQRQELPDFLDLCALFQGICHNTEDQLEAVNAFLEKRDARYGDS